MIEKPGSPITSQVINDLIGDPFFLDRSQPCLCALSSTGKVYGKKMGRKTVNPSKTKPEQHSTATMADRWLSISND